MATVRRAQNHPPSSTSPSKQDDINSDADSSKLSKELSYHCRLASLPINFMMDPKPGRAYTREEVEMFEKAWRAQQKRLMNSQPVTKSFQSYKFFLHFFHFHFFTAI